jgi:hypothetical protein
LDKEKVKAAEQVNLFAYFFFCFFFFFNALDIFSAYLRMLLLTLLREAGKLAG